MVLSGTGVTRRRAATKWAGGAGRSSFPRRSRTIPWKFPVAVWAFEEFGSAEKERGRGMGGAGIRGGMEERGRFNRTRGAVGCRYGMRRAIDGPTVVRSGW